MKVDNFTIIDRCTITGCEPKSCRCEGMGVIPVFIRKGNKNKCCIFCDDEKDDTLITLWENAEIKSKTVDGWHFVSCPECNINL